MEILSFSRYVYVKITAFSVHTDKCLHVSIFKGELDDARVHLHLHNAIMQSDPRLNLESIFKMKEQVT